eukprot:5852345-Lingulodinium_polyedra.AAC.1
MAGEAQQLLLDYAGHCRTLPDHKVAELARLAEALKTLLQEKAHSFIEERKEEPLLCSYTSDGAPLRHRQRKQVDTSAVHTQRVGNVYHEFLVEQACLRFLRRLGRRAPQ